MVRSPRIELRILSLLKAKTMKRRTIIVGLNSDTRSREMLLRLLTLVARSGDNVLAVHVQEPDDGFDPNTFHIHEDLCKTKQVSRFPSKGLYRESFLSELTKQVRVNLATILALGCSTPWPQDSFITNCLKHLPPTCSLLIMDKGGRILIQRQGTSQQGTAIEILQKNLSSPLKYNSFEHSEANYQLQKSLTMPSSDSDRQLKKLLNMSSVETSHHFKKALTMPSSPTSSSTRQTKSTLPGSVKKMSHFSEFTTKKLFEKLSILEAKGSSRRFTLEELISATKNFSPKMVIGEGGNSMVYRASLDNGRPAAVKVLKASRWAAEDLLQEVEMLGSLKHENIVSLVGYCYCTEMHAVVCDLLNESLKRKLKQLQWRERIKVAIGVGRALEYLHSSIPPIIHRDVKSSNILLTEDCEPQLSDFGAAIKHQNSQQPSPNTMPLHVVGTFGYLAPEYMMYGKVDEKIDVYSYGVLLLELITGKEAIQTSQMSNHESLVLWARSLLNRGLCERLIDPSLQGDYNKEEMKRMMIAARLCLMHSSSRRPTMKTVRSLSFQLEILKLFEEPDFWLKMQRERDEFLDGVNSKCESLCSRSENNTDSDGTT
ncbi:Protein kinase domain [Dillenia turbinata]|uniref:Protein kinase domain n=1 Tax=Dillenia turbinata TaxID=194707 RepID=A0AAN8W5K6_9MAGN